MKSELLNLDLNILGIGPNAEAALAENFSKIDQHLKDNPGGSGVSPHAANIFMSDTMRPATGVIRESDTVEIALMRLQGRIDALEARVDSLESAGEPD